MNYQRTHTEETLKKWREKKICGGDESVHTEYFTKYTSQKASFMCFASLGEPPQLTNVKKI